MIHEDATRGYQPACGTASSSLQQSVIPTSISSGVAVLRELISVSAERHEQWSVLN